MGVDNGREAAEQADAVRAQALQVMAAITGMRQRGLEREGSRLAAKLSEDHPSVQRLSLLVEEGSGRLKEMNVEIARARISTPRPEEGTWTLRGFVFNNDLTPAQNLTVSLADPKGKGMESAGFTCTDENGYFKLATKAPDGDGSEKPKAAASASEAVEAHVVVSDAKGARLHRSEEALEVVGGRVVYREIKLNGGDASCEPPAGRTRKPRARRSKS